MTVQTLGQRLQTTRRACGLTQMQLAVQSRVPVGAIAAIEQELTRTPYFTDVALLARVLGVDAQWLYDGNTATRDPR
jgi:transcriptional regulator with XRE-family HTH domain